MHIIAGLNKESLIYILTIPSPLHKEGHALKFWSICYKTEYWHHSFHQIGTNEGATDEEQTFGTYIDEHTMFVLLSYLLSFFTMAISTVCSVNRLQ